MINRFKKMIVMLLVLLTVCTCFGGVSFAGYEPTISAAQVTGKPGETVTVDVNVFNNPGIVLMKLCFEYDTSVMELIGSENGIVFIGSDITMVNSHDYNANPYSMSWLSTSTTDITTNGLLARLTFKIKDNASVGMCSEVTISYNEIDVLNVELQSVTFGLEHGLVMVDNSNTVTYVDGLTNIIICTEVVKYGSDATFPTPPNHEGYIFTGWSHNGKNITEDIMIFAQYEKRYKSGDVNMDGKVNTGDAVLILRQSVGLTEFNDEQIKLADFNGDSNVNTGDAVSVLMLSVGFIGAEG